jgi:hypothetical protein
MFEQFDTVESMVFFFEDEKTHLLMIPSAFLKALHDACMANATARHSRKQWFVDFFLNQKRLRPQKPHGYIYSDYDIAVESDARSISEYFIPIRDMAEPLLKKLGGTAPGISWTQN